MAKNLLVAQSGGPTAAINATLAGILEAGLRSPEVDRVFGALHGIQGVLSENFVDIEERFTALAREEWPDTVFTDPADPTNRLLNRLSVTPSAALGSCRYKLKDPAEDPSEFEALLRIFRAHEIRYFIYIGGNDSMDTVAKLSRFLKERNVTDITVVGAPKTIDNDLFGIDHCPGFGSAAKYIATTLSELERELVVYDTEYVIVVEMMGRNAGWLTAAAALAEGQNSRLPYLIYLEELPFDFSRFLQDVREAVASHRQVIVAVSEGIRDIEGRMICEYAAPPRLDNEGSLTMEPAAAEAGSGAALDAFGHKIASGAAKILEQAVQQAIGCKTRSIELNLLQRCAGHLLSETDITESRTLGMRAVDYAVEGRNGAMSSLQRMEGDEPALSEYRVRYFPQDVEKSANFEKKVPKEWINEAGNGVTEACRAYLRPLVQGELRSEYRDGVPLYLTLL